MYIWPSPTKNKYKFYLYHSKRINGKSTKILSKHVFSLDKELLEPDPYGPPVSADTILEDHFDCDDMNKFILNHSDSIPEQLRKDFNSSNIYKLIYEKITKLMGN